MARSIKVMLVGGWPNFLVVASLLCLEQCTCWIILSCLSESSTNCDDQAGAWHGKGPHGLQVPGHLLGEPEEAHYLGSRVGGA